jgi:hypothetical protein
MATGGGQGARQVETIAMIAQQSKTHDKSPTRNRH